MDYHQKYKIKVEYGVSAVVFAIGVFFLILASTIDTSREAIGPRTLPLVLALSLLAGGVFLAVRAFTGRAGDLREGYGFLESDVTRIFLVIACGALFLFLFWGFGFFTAVLLTYIAMLLTFGVRSVPAMIGGALIIASVFQVLFVGIMVLNDPSGAIVDLRPYTDALVNLVLRGRSS